MTESGTVLPWLMEVEAMLHELLALRAQRRLDAYRRESRAARERKRDSVATYREPRNLNSSAALADVKAVTSRRGFLQEQLRAVPLTPLKQWHVQLQLIEMDERDTLEPNALGADRDREQSGVTTTKLERTLAAIQRDRRCFDISYVGSTARIADLKETLFGASDQSLHVCEALAFSSTRDGYTARVVLYRSEKTGSVGVRSSLYVRGLQDHVDELMGGSNPGAVVDLFLD